MVRKVSKIKEYYVPDTSVIIEGGVTKLVDDKKIKGTIIIHKAVIKELEHQANLKKPSGLVGIDEVKNLKKLTKQGVSVEFAGEAPNSSQIRYAKSGEIDSLIREYAGEKNATLITGDSVQHEIAQATGVKSLFLKFDKEVKSLSIEKFFDDSTMSIHLRDGTTPKAKKGKPGEWEFTELSDKKLSTKEMENYSKEIVEKTNMDNNSFIEIDKKGSTIVQFRNYRIVMTRPPLSDGWEITAVRPVKILSLKDYSIDDKLNQRFKLKAEGILVAGAPGNGKSTFCQALGLFYLENNKIVKTVEAPRDLILPPEITQYSKNIGTNSEIHDILLLSRPDYTIFDEIRNTNDFKLFKDLRLSGVGMVGVVHATNPIDAIQRFIGRVELGMVPSIIDTVIFIEKGDIGRVLEVSITVRVPSGMTEMDLARPIVEVKDFKTGELVYEMYTFGEQTVVIPVKGINKTSTVMSLAQDALKEKVGKELKGMPFELKMTSENSMDLFVPSDYVSKVIGKKGARVDNLEKKLNIKIQVRELEKTNNDVEGVPFRISVGKRNTELILDSSMRSMNFDVYVNGEYLLTATSSKTGKIKVNNKSEVGKKLLSAKNLGKEIKLILQ